jgi:hypothetical protein
MFAAFAQKVFRMRSVRKSRVASNNAASAGSLSDAGLSLSDGQPLLGGTLPFADELKTISSACRIHP